MHNKGSIISASSRHCLQLTEYYFWGMINPEKKIIIIIIGTLGDSANYEQY